MLSILSTPLFRKILSAIITIGIGFYIGYSLRNDQIKSLRKEKNFAKGEFKQLNTSYHQLRVTTDTLQSVIIQLAQQERIQVANYISDTKVKDGSTLNFVPKTRANLSVVKTKMVDVIPLVIVPTAPTDQPTVPTPKKNKDKNFFGRLFSRRRIK
ncbi:MAG: hypothetical protein COA88_13600 [Kordia sp.]|nr:MAG: hypothetical protein COA88_13600 [Kordia sp.]